METEQHCFVDTAQLRNDDLNNLVQSSKHAPATQHLVLPSLPLQFTQWQRDFLLDTNGLLPLIISAAITRTAGINRTPKNLRLGIKLTGDISNHPLPIE